MLRNLRGFSMNMFWVPSDTIMTLPGESQTHKPFKNRNFQVFNARSICSSCSVDTSTQIWYTCMRTNFIKGNEHISQCLLRSFESLSYPTHELPKPIRVYTWPRNAGCQLRKASGGPWANVIVRFFLGSTASFANKFRFSKIFQS